MFKYKDTFNRNENDTVITILLRFGSKPNAHSVVRVQDSPGPSAVVLVKLRPQEAWGRTSQQEAEMSLRKTPQVKLVIKLVMLVLSLSTDR